MGTKKKFDEKTLPVTVNPENNEFVSFYDFRKNRDAGFPLLENLDDDTLESLVIERIKRAPDLELAVIGGTPVKKEQLIREIIAKTPMGLDAIELEKRAIRMMLRKEVTDAT